jgi:hypothetical protein
MEWLLSFAILYIGIYIPFKYWQVSGKYDYLKKDTDAKISQLEYNQNYYIEQINSYKQQVKTLTDQSEGYKWLWIEASSDLERIENVLHDEDPSELTDKLFEILWAGEGEEVEDDL